MNIQYFTAIYAAVLHVCAVVAVVVLLALGKGNQTALLVALGGLLGFAVGVPVSAPGTVPTPPNANTQP